MQSALLFKWRGSCGKGKLPVRGGRSWTSGGVVPMVIAALLSLLSISAAAHIFFLIAYVRTRDESYLRKFLNTAVINVIIACACIFIGIFRPALVRAIDGPTLMWLMSGIIMMLMALLQISIFMKVRARASLPEYYHYNYFGKKVLNPSVLKAVDVVLFFLSLPFLIVAGAYFVARIVRQLL